MACSITDQNKKLNTLISGKLVACEGEPARIFWFWCICSRQPSQVDVFEFDLGAFSFYQNHHVARVSQPQDLPATRAQIQAQIDRETHAD